MELAQFFVEVSSKVNSRLGGTTCSTTQRIPHTKIVSLVLGRCVQCHQEDKKLVPPINSSQLKILSFLDPGKRDEFFNHTRSLDSWLLIGNILDGFLKRNDVLMTRDQFRVWVVLGNQFTNFREEDDHAIN